MRCSSTIAPSRMQDVGSKRRRDVQVLARQPREQAVADQSVAEMRRQHAQRAGEGRDAEVVAQRHPAGPQRAMRVHHALGLAGGSRGEQDQRVVVQAARRCRGLLVPVSVVPTTPTPASISAARRGVRGIVHDGEARSRGRHQRAHLERREARVDRHRARAEAPDRKQLGEELQPVAEMQEDPVAAARRRAPGTARCASILRARSVGGPSAGRPPPRRDYRRLDR